MVQIYRELVLKQVRQRVTDRGKPQEEDGSGTAGPRRRTDLRLALPAALVWGGSIAGLWLTPAGLATLCCALAALGGVLLACAAKGGTVRKGRPAVGPLVRSRRSGVRARSLPAALGVSLVLAAAAAAHSATASSQRFDGPLADAVAAGKSAVAVVEVAGSPKSLSGPGGTAQRWSVPVWSREVATGGVLVRTRAQLLVLGGDAWGAVLPGQTLRIAGKLRAPEPGGQDAGLLA
ncbi:MAG: ComEC/Rec2 family competence protein, partial [Pseudarthrobacter sp.]|nr:ComEC/Rec2 family competence protein [Pseudarthrobacter sp.]